MTVTTVMMINGGGKLWKKQALYYPLQYSEIVDIER